MAAPSRRRSFTRRRLHGSGACMAAGQLVVSAIAYVIRDGRLDPEPQGDLRLGPAPDLGAPGWALRPA